MAKKSIGILQAALRLEASQFKKELKGANQGWADFAKKFAIPAAVVTAGLVGIKKSIDAAIQAFEFLKEQLAGIEEVGRMADRLGVGIETFSALGKAMASAGVDAATFGTSMQRMRAKIGDALRGNQEAIQAFASIKLDPAQLAMMNLAEQVNAVGYALAAMNDEQKQMSATRKIFDSEGMKLLQFFRAENYAVMQLTERYKQLGLALDQDAYEAAAKFSGELGMVNEALDKFKEDIAVAVVGTQEFDRVGSKVALMLKDVAEELDRIMAFSSGFLETVLGPSGVGAAFRQWNRFTNQRMEDMALAEGLNEAVRRSEARRAGMPVPGDRSDDAAMWRSAMDEYDRKQAERDREQNSILQGIRDSMSWGRPVNW